MNIKFIRGYFVSFFRFYLFRKPRLLLTIALTIIIFIWISIIYNDLITHFEAKGALPENIAYLIRSGSLYLLFIKPIFAYIAGIIIIKNI